MKIEELVILGLATWRIASLFVRESGPFGVFVFVRSKIAGIQHDDEKKPWIIPDTFIGELLSCVWCFSMWVAFVLMLSWMISPAITFFACIPFALSTTAIYIQKQLDA